MAHFTMLKSAAKSVSTSPDTTCRSGRTVRSRCHRLERISIGSLWQSPVVTGLAVTCYRERREKTGERLGSAMADAWQPCARPRTPRYTVIVAGCGLIKAIGKVTTVRSPARPPHLSYSDLGGARSARAGSSGGRRACPVLIHPSARSIKWTNAYGLTGLATRFVAKRSRAGEGYMDYVSLQAPASSSRCGGYGPDRRTSSSWPANKHALCSMTRPVLAQPLRTVMTVALGHEPLFVSLPEGEDPDSLVRKGGANALAVPCLAKAVDGSTAVQILQTQILRVHEGGRRASIASAHLRAAATPP